MVETFRDLKLDKTLLANIETAGYSSPTPIQRQAIPLAQAGHDILGIAQTGTGKTAAFALPILDHLIRDRKDYVRKSTRVLVLSPTRELAGQILDNFKIYGRGKRLRMTLLVGGKSMNNQIETLQEGVDVLVATPGRLMDHVRQKTLHLNAVDFAVVDEADQMMDMGFVHELKRIARLLPKQHQTLFFSATMPKPIRQIANLFLNDPEEISVAPSATPAANVRQKMLMVEKPNKRKMVVRILRSETVMRAIIFVRTKRSADTLLKHLTQEGISSVVLHGDRSQNQRTRALADFKKANVNILVATDVAARGIDVDNITHVINMDLPGTAETYVHRIGRTARAGSSGVSISLVSSEETSELRAIEKLLKKKLDVVSFEGVDLVAKPKKSGFDPAGNSGAQVAVVAEEAPKKKKKHRKGSAPPAILARSTTGERATKGSRGKKPFVKGGGKAAGGKAGGAKKATRKTSFGKPVQPKNKPQRPRRPTKKK